MQNLDRIHGNLRFVKYVAYGVCLFGAPACLFSDTFDTNVSVKALLSPINTTDVFNTIAN